MPTNPPRAAQLRPSPSPASPPLPPCRRRRPGARACPAARARLALLLLLLLLLCAAGGVRAANPVKAPIVFTGHFVHTRPFAQLPRAYNGRPAKIICMVAHRDSLFVCDQTRIYRISYAGHVSLWLDVLLAIQVGSSFHRHLSLESPVHGGLRSIAFHPRYDVNRLFYLAIMESRPWKPWNFKYVSDVPDAIPADSVIVEMAATGNHHMPSATTYRCVLRVGVPTFDHTIRQIAFYEDLLYITHGDGSEQSARVGGGQNADARGKLLRIDPVAGANGEPYRIPSDNPYAGGGLMPPEVWASGFRNPHNLCFAADGTLFVADTGRANVEEIDIVVRGANYGWSLREGTFVHVGGGIEDGVEKLPADDDLLGFTYPAAQVGHEGERGEGWVGQAIAGACPVENGSPMSARYYYADFPKSGRLLFSQTWELKQARTTGKPWQLTQAPTYEAKICYYDDARNATRAVRYDTLGDAMRSEAAFAAEERIDMRFGRGSRGELYWSSKTTGRVYVFLSSLPGGPRGPCPKPTHGPSPTPSSTATGQPSATASPTPTEQVL